MRWLLLSGLCVNFEDPKSIAFGIEKISLPAGAGHRKFWQCNFAALAEYDLSGRVAKKNQELTIEATGDNEATETQLEIKTAS